MRRIRSRRAAAGVIVVAAACTIYAWSVISAFAHPARGASAFALQYVIPANDNFAAATVVSALPFSDTVDLTGATLEPGEPPGPPGGVSGHTVWYAFTPASDVVFRVSLATSGGPAFTIYEANSPGLGGLAPYLLYTGLGVPNPTAVFRAQGGVTYYVQVGTTNFGNDPAPVTFSLAAIPPPPNDDFANATPLTGLPASPSVALIAATIQPGEPVTPPCFPSDSLRATAWYTFTPATSGTYGLDVLGGIVSVYNGNSLTGLTRISCITNFGGLSPGSWPAAAGTTYYIQVGLNGGGEVPTRLTLVGPLSPQTVTFSSTPPTSALFGGTYTPSAGGGGSGNPVVFSIDLASTPGACWLPDRTVVFTGSGTCILDANQAGNIGYFPADQAQQVIQIGFSRTLSGSRSGSLTVRPGESVYLSPRTVIGGPVAVQAGGALRAEGAKIAGSISASGANAIHLCGSTVTGALTITQTSGLIVVGDDDGPTACPGNKITAPVKITANLGGVEFDENTVTGPLTITGNTGSLPPPDGGPVDATRNTVSGKVTIQP